MDESMIFHRFWFVKVLKRFCPIGSKIRCRHMFENDAVVMGKDWALSGPSRAGRGCVGQVVALDRPLNACGYGKKLELEKAVAMASASQDVLTSVLLNRLLGHLEPILLLAYKKKKKRKKFQPCHLSGPVQVWLKV
ncbi:Hypp2250 [Branchiostoma lanceolatum]|uniref:Hypp2250 protein n=1 Tax=Branchiostoma lanceolatum TaxID=7740 RepID=A0A8J9ZPP1_BRALA|nr:Hypp2250 [Branchiostoma lanceolatum]